MHLNQRGHNNKGPLTRMNECEESNRMNGEWRRQKEEVEVLGIFLEFQKIIGFTRRILGTQSKSPKENILKLLEIDLVFFHIKLTDW